MATESVFLSGIKTLTNLGFFEFFLPFLLFFAIIYGALQKTKVFGERKDIDAIIALVIALIASTTAWVIQGITGFLPWVGFIALVIVCLLMLVGMVYGDVGKLLDNKLLIAGIVLGVVVAILAVLFYTLGFNTLLGPLGLTDTDLALIMVAIMGIGLFIVIYKGGFGGTSSSK